MKDIINILLTQATILHNDCFLYNESYPDDKKIIQNKKLIFNEILKLILIINVTIDLKKKLFELITFIKNLENSYNESKNRIVLYDEDVLKSKIHSIILNDNFFL